MDQGSKIREEKLFTLHQRRRKTILNQSQLQQEAWVEENTNFTIKEIKIKIQEKFGLNITKRAVNYNIQRIKFSYITPSPLHNGQDKNKQEEFKKNLNETIVMY